MAAVPLDLGLDDTPAGRVVTAIEQLEAAVILATDEESRDRPDWRYAALLWLDVGTAALVVQAAARAACQAAHERREEER
jgi:hypothetical protein